MEAGEQGLEMGEAMIDGSARESGYRRLRVWHLGMEVVEEAYRLTAAFPKQETYGLASQIQRAAVSIPSNIAEGHTRDHLKEFIRFVSIARGSVSEFETQIELARRIRYISDDAARNLLSKLEHLGRQLTNLRTSLNNKIHEGSPVYDADFTGDAQ